MREKLIKLLDQNFGYVEEQTAEKLADYLIANGVIAPTCKVGDTVYVFVGKVNPSIISKLEISINCWDVDFSYEAIGGPCPIQFCEENIGKSVFLTREEAERALSIR